MKEIKNAKLTIGRISSNIPGQNNNIEIEVKDEHYNTIVKIAISPENFALAVTGLAMIKCDIKVEEEV